jgi:hypothetical protein|tara:strand:- start:4183 stop:4458 length:276 start_codon:yes stop_codon:yes gene_type:complete
MKLLLTKILPLALPVLIYLVWLFYAHKRAQKRGTQVNQLSDAPWLLIGLSGLTALIIGMIVLGLFTGEDIGGNYIPSHLENGEVVKGRIDR